MSFNLSGVVINNNYKDKLNEMERELGWTLDFDEEIHFEKASENWKDEGICDIYFSEQGTLLFLNMEMCIVPWNVETGNTLTFALSETSMAFNFNYCEGRDLKRSFMEVNGDRMSEEGKKLSVEDNTGDVSEIIWAQLGTVLGKTFWSIDPDEKAYRYKIVSTKNHPL